MKILHLIDSLGDGDSTRQLQLLGPALAPSAALEVCCLGPDAPASAPLRQAGIILQALGWTRWFDPSVLWNLGKVLREADADVIHVWSLLALRALAVVAPGLLPRVVMSATLPAAGKLAWWDRRLLKHVYCAAPIGVVAEPGRQREESANPSLALGLGPTRIVCVGRLEREDGFRDAIWAFDFLLLLHPDAQLQIAGTGSQREALQALTQGLRSASSVRFLGAPSDIAALLEDADIVWVPSLANRGRQVALEAMALGKPVVACDVPCLREVIQDGGTGFLIPPGDVVALARRTRVLLQDQPLRERVGQAARQYVQNQFSVGGAVERWRELYRTIAA
jgi:glycosyltransferase involved in cell wall biosynthesis